MLSLPVAPGRAEGSRKRRSRPERVRGSGL